MVRLVSGDLTRWESGPSPCGRTYPILPRGIYGRIDDQFTVRGENILPSAIDEVLTALPGYGGEHRILVSREEAMDELTVQVEHLAEVEDLEALRRRAEAELRRTLGVGARVLLLAPGTLQRTEFKARRVIDSREVLRRARA
jgi:phenylacetate-CoA ligase